MASEDRFGYEWDLWSQEKNLMPEFEQQFWEWLNPLDKSFLKNKKILNAGCGFGRHSLFCLQNGASSVVSFDNDAKSVQRAEELLKSFKNSEVKKISIYDIDYKNKFDFVFSIGVIHHLKQPQLAMQRLKDSLKKNGTLFIMVYSKEGNAELRFISFLIRKITPKLPLSFLKFASLFPTTILYALLKLNLLHQDYYQIIRNYNFKHIHLLVFDHLIPEVNKYYSLDQVKELMIGLDDVHIRHSKKKCWVAYGKKI